MVARGPLKPWFQNVSTSKAPQVCQSQVENLEQRIFWQHFEAQRNLKTQLNKIQRLQLRKGYMEDLIREEIQLQFDLNQLLKKEDILWKKKYRFNWLKEGEKS